MSKTWKTLLHEYFQRNGLEAPEYETKRMDNDGMDHMPEWKATIKIGDKIFEGIDTSKKDAGATAAQKAYEFLTENKIPELEKEKEVIIKQIERKQKVNEVEDVPFNNYNEILLLDGENCNIDMSKVKNNMLVLIFAAKNTTKNNIFTLQQNYDNCYVFLSQSVGKDAADHLLTFYAGKLSILLDGNNINYYILTKDHYGEFIEKFMPNCKFICDATELS